MDKNLELEILGDKIAERIQKLYEKNNKPNRIWISTIINVIVILIAVVGSIISFNVKVENIANTIESHISNNDIHRTTAQDMNTFVQLGQQNDLKQRVTRLENLVYKRNND